VRPVSRRRSRLDIVLAVLSAVGRGVDRPTRIMYASNLSWRPMQRRQNDFFVIPVDAAFYADFSS